jgi:hypothetical protein
VPESLPNVKIELSRSDAVVLSAQFLQYALTGAG